MNRTLFLSQKKKVQYDNEHQDHKIKNIIFFQDPDILKIYNYLVNDYETNENGYSYEQIIQFILQSFDVKNRNELISLSMIVDKQNWRNICSTANLFHQYLLQMLQYQFIDMQTILLLEEFIIYVKKSEYIHQFKDQLCKPLVEFEIILTQMLLTRDKSNIQQSLSIFQAYNENFMLLRSLFQPQQINVQIPTTLIELIFTFLTPNMVQNVVKQLLLTLSVLASDQNAVQFIDDYVENNPQTNIPTYKFVRQIAELQKLGIYDQEIIKYLNELFKTIRNGIGQCHVMAYYNAGIMEKYFNQLVDSQIKPRNLLYLMYQATVNSHIFYDDEKKMNFFVTQLRSTNAYTRLMSVKTIRNLIYRFDDPDYYENYVNQILEAIIFYLKEDNISNELLDDVLHLIRLIYREFSIKVMDYQIMQHILNYQTRGCSVEQEEIIQRFLNQI